MIIKRKKKMVKESCSCATNLFKGQNVLLWVTHHTVDRNLSTDLRGSQTREGMNLKVSFKAQSDSLTPLHLD